MGQEGSREWERDKGGNEVTALTAVDKEPLLGSRTDWGGAALGVGTCSHRGKGWGSEHHKVPPTLALALGQ